MNSKRLLPKKRNAQDANTNIQYQTHKTSFAKPQIQVDPTEVRCPKGTFQTERIVEAQKVISLKRQEILFKEAEKKRKKSGDATRIMPLEYDLQSIYKQLPAQNAQKDDTLHFREGKFHADEQKEKTEELMKSECEILEGFDSPDDPGFWPAIEYFTPGGTKKPAYIYNSMYTGKEFKIFPLTWNQIGSDWTIICLGRRRSGKTRFIFSLMGHRLRPLFPRIVVFTKTKCSAEYSKHVPDAYIIPGLDCEKLLALYVLQKQYKELQMQGKFHGNMKLLIILDDCLSDGLKYQKLIDEVFFEGRHLDISFIVSSQDCKGINPACTGNADLAVVFAMRSERDKDAIRSKFCDFFKNDEDMEALITQVTYKKWHSVCFDQSEPSRDPRFTIFGGRAPEPPPFVMGAKAWWKRNPKQLAAIIDQYPEELGHLEKRDDWGVIGEDEMNQVL